LELEDVPLDVELVIELPGRMADSKRVGRYNLLITRKKVHLRVEHRHEIVEWNLAFKNAHAPDVHCRFLSFKVQEAGVRRGEPAIKVGL
jgi:hypothetical protein